MSAAETTPGWNPIQRVILPSTDQTDTVPLYVDAGTASGIRLRENDEFARTPKLLEDKLQMFSSESRVAHFEDLLGTALHARALRRAALVRHLLQRLPGQLLAPLDRRCGTSAWSSRRPARATVIGLQSPTPADRSSASTASTSTATPPRRSTCSLKPFGDGGWYWFDLVAGAGDAGPERTVRGRPPRPVPRPRRQVTLEITTMNRPDFCAEQRSRSLADEPGRP